jgi:DNA helicase-2/ATP-dependent DNA helicase PcrA
MTRAMEQLSLSCARERRRFGTRTYQSPSRFLREIPEALMDVRGSPGPARRRRENFAPDRGRRLDRSYSQEQPEDMEAGVQEGMRVRHPVFGVGAVVAVFGAGLDQKLKIKFERAGIKTIMVRYANLEPA